MTLMTEAEECPCSLEMEDDSRYDDAGLTPWLRCVKGMIFILNPILQT